MRLSTVLTIIIIDIAWIITIIITSLNITIREFNSELDKCLLTSPCYGLCFMVYWK